MTDEIDTSAPYSWSTCIDCPADDEARRLRTRLAEVEAERDAAWANAKERRAQVYEMCARAEKAEAENRRLSGRLCVTCGATFPASQSRSQPGKGCPEPHCCSIDMTLEEAFLHWRKEAHDRRVERDAERARAEKAEAERDEALRRETETTRRYDAQLNDLQERLSFFENMAGDYARAVLRRDEGGE